MGIKIRNDNQWLHLLLKNEKTDAMNDIFVQPSMNRRIDGAA
jgi:hypothetical protein